ncbi:hypothetical protein [Methylocella sp. CPCC 101449]|uniref:hypothetical protein n=1 Tax=Methylocella sp. CPCC 101449 TaxID=2987531 RepID=UPI00288F9484|nr:hypothetical protein [Methylocella sp. CPCC 101449]MDT2022813.1 hypothetical protein [Methylocella sp. CPCC 101449]
MIMISAIGSQGPVAIVATDNQQQHSVHAISRAPEYEGLHQALAAIDPGIWENLQTLLRNHPAGITFTLLDEVGRRRIADAIRLERARRAFEAARRAPDA